jgi:diaminohydroxyphosphoribosylaminopyrimidine deaminase/5-amino-6-(5-phosphoribosylamino)uracil reductase
VDAKLLLGEYVSEPKRWEPLSDTQAMKLAIQEAFRGAGFVSPNPLVGCVILDANNRFLAKGYHARVGGAHAEIHALSFLSDVEIKDARVFVTLEPCAHEGRTPSCAKTLAKLPIREVIFGLVDPNPAVSGQGAEILRQAGKAVTHFVTSVGQDQKQWLQWLEITCEHFLWNYRRQQIFVSVKVASSFDGQMALKSGESKWITGEEARAYGHYLRGFHDAVAVGKQTVLRDNPALDIRESMLKGKLTKVVVFDSQGELLGQNLDLFEKHKPENLIWVVAQGVNRKDSRVGHIVQTNSPVGTHDLSSALKSIYDLGVRSMMVEGGAHLISSFISQQKAQRIYVMQAPVIMGAAFGKPWSEDVRIEKMSDRIALQGFLHQKLGQDLLISANLFQSL